MKCIDTEKKETDLSTVSCYTATAFSCLATSHTYLEHFRASYSHYISVPIHINLHSRNARKKCQVGLPLYQGTNHGCSDRCTGVPFMFPPSSHLVVHKDHNESFQSTARQRRDVIPHQILWFSVALLDVMLQKLLFLLPTGEDPFIKLSNSSYFMLFWGTKDYQGFV